MREKKLREIEKMAEVIRELAVPGMKFKALIETVRACFPGAARKEVARAAFLSVIHSAEYDTQALHDLAMDTRDSTDR
jgi:hypothetical protein